MNWHPNSRLRYAWFFPVWPLAWTAALHPNLAQPDFPAYLKALADAAREEYRRRNPPQ